MSDILKKFSIMPMGHVFINGTFDIIHRGHLKLFEAASILTGYGVFNLVIAIDSDRRVRELKGDSRPINNQDDRKYMLQSIKNIGRVEIFDSSEELEEIIRQGNYKYMVKGIDYRDKPIVGSHLVEEIIFIDLLTGYSTTDIIGKSDQLRGNKLC